MTTLTLRIPDSLANDIDVIARDQHSKRSEIIRRAITNMITELSKQKERNQLMNLSQRVRAESMRINAEFAPADYEFEDESR